MLDILTFLISLAIIFSIFSFGEFYEQKSYFDSCKIDLLIKKSEESKSDVFIIYEDDEILVEEYSSVGYRDSLIQPWSFTKGITALSFIA